MSRSNNPKRTVELIKSNVEFVKKITGNKRYPLLIFLADYDEEFYRCE